MIDVILIAEGHNSVERIAIVPSWLTHEFPRIYHGMTSMMNNYESSEMVRMN